MKPISQTQSLKATHKGLATKGISGVQVDALAKRLGISKGRFYWHIKAREEPNVALLDYWAY